MREVAEGDAMTWLEHIPPGRGSVVTSLPDAEEVDLSVGAWELWFEAAAERCFQVSNGPTVFVQTDRRFEGRWISKPILIHRASMEELLWHRILLRREPGKADVRKPTYTHVLAYGPGKPGDVLPDVMPVGKALWAAGTPVHAAYVICNWMKEQGAKAIINPFSGRGTLLAAANLVGLDAYGCELDPQRVKLAEKLELELGDGG